MHAGDETNIREYRPRNTGVCLKREERVTTIRGEFKKMRPMIGNRLNASSFDF